MVGDGLLFSFLGLRHHAPVIVGADSEGSEKGFRRGDSRPKSEFGVLERVKWITSRSVLAFPRLRLSFSHCSLPTWHRRGFCVVTKLFFGFPCSLHQGCCAVGRIDVGSLVNPIPSLITYGLFWGQ